MEYAEFRHRSSDYESRVAFRGFIAEGARSGRWMCHPSDLYAEILSVLMMSMLAFYITDFGLGPVLGEHDQREQVFPSSRVLMMGNPSESVFGKVRGSRICSLISRRASALFRLDCLADSTASSVSGSFEKSRHGDGRAQPRSSSEQGASARVTVKRAPRYVSTMSNT